MDCPRCGTPRQDLEATCPCGYASESSDEGSAKPVDASVAALPKEAEQPTPEPKRRKKKRTKRKRTGAMEVDNDWISLHSDHRMSVLTLLFLYIVTCGFYGTYWYVSRQPFLDGLSSPTKIGTNFPLVLVIGACINILIAVLVVMAPDIVVNVLPVTRVFSMALTVATILIAFRVRRVLQEHGARVQPGYDVSAVGTFIFGALYLQYKINRLPTQAPIDGLVREFE